MQSSLNNHDNTITRNNLAIMGLFEKWIRITITADEGPFHEKSSHVEEKNLSNSAMKTSIYYVCIAYLICSKTNWRIQYIIA